MQEIFNNSELRDIAEKVYSGRRLTREDGIRLYRSNDLLTIGRLANYVREQKNGNNAYFIVNRHINHTNICVNRCQLCAFGRDADDPEAYVLSLDEIEAKARSCRNEKISEIHIVGGLHPQLPLDYYLEMLRRVRRALPNVIIQSFTAVEVDYLARLHNMSLEDVLKALMDAGLDSLPGGGAEIFAPRVRKIICSKKISGERWLEVHKAAHRLGMRTNSTMLYGHVETIEERIDHMLALREAQDETGGFLTFIPLAFHPQNTQLEPMKLARTTGYDDLKTYAISRLMLDNFDHIKAFWILIGPKLAQVSLSFGVDDLDGTVVEENIAHDAGADTDQYMPKKRLVEMIKAAGRYPVERDTLYNVLGEGF
ncbi:aminodeoxyfutalosine synthase [Desulfohalotomaculum tongense]|uniref:aminofutalosine synthase MqnE n=1 Tax=Desulforadius tongensis TaxID=1216062 RepID=UPI001957D4A2|nr:aminofutalosine synthase MqnE [Desulforadius tongensis]MBM7855896.1 aminodeoxyfutalosine synthase [Desulforadius tongensis]